MRGTVFALGELDKGSRERHVEVIQVSKLSDKEREVRAIDHLADKLLRDAIIQQLLMEIRSELLCYSTQPSTQYTQVTRSRLRTGLWLCFFFLLHKHVGTGSRHLLLLD